jgi:diguanylate cyclase (GGDEF)-like protein/PAS domain S-box-containing protein
MFERNVLRQQDTKDGTSGGIAAPSPPADSFRDDPARWHLNPIALTIACGVILLASIGIGTVMMILQFRDRTLVRTDRELTHTAQLLARHLDKEFEELTLVQKDIVERIQSAGITSTTEFIRQLSSRDFHLMLREKIRPMPQIAGVGVVDADGKLINTSRTWPFPTISVINKGFYKTLKANMQSDVFVTEPVRNQADGALSVIFARRVSGPNGEFLGLVLGSIEPQYFQSFFASLDLEEHRTLLLLRGDGTVLTRYPADGTPETVYKNLFDSVENGGAVIGPMTAGADGHERLMSANRLAHFPLVTAVSIEANAALADWREQTRFLLGVAGLTALVIATIICLVVRRLFKEHKLAKQRIALEKHRLDIATDNMPQALLMFDGAARIVIVNRRYIDMFNVSPDVVKPGCAFIDLLEHRRATGSFTGDANEYCNMVRRDIDQGHITEILLQATDGRYIRIVNTPMGGGGWIATIEDVTHQRNLEQERERDREFLNQIIDNIPVMIAVKDVEERKYKLFNRTAEALWGISRTEALGKSADELLPAEQANSINKHDDESLASATPVVLEAHPNMASNDDQRIVTSKRLAIRDKDGKPRYIVSVVEDITERKHLEHERDRNREFLNLIIDNIPSSILVKDARERRYVLVNSSTEASLGVLRQDLIGRTAQEILQPEMADIIAEQDREQLISEGRIFFDEFTINSPHLGPRIVTSNRVTIFDVNGEPQYLVSVVDDITDRKRADARIAHLAHHDVLTDLPNRLLFREQLEQALRNMRNDEHVAVLYCDLDNFKDVNDTLGHPTGDALLKAVAVRLRDCIGDENTAARLGGDEFAIIQTGVNSSSDVSNMVQRIYEVIRKPYQWGNHQFTADASFGIAMAPNDGTDPDQLLKNADMALYGAKSDGRSTYRFFETAMDARVKARRALEVDLRDAIASEGFELHYQPIIDLGTNKITSCEALLRWYHPQRGLVPPAEFIPAAEETGLITALGEWVLKTACHEAMKWPSDIKVAVNVSPVQFRSQTLPLTIIAALAESGLPAHRLIIEITEAVLIRDDAAALAMLNQLRVLGVQIAMDDFGTGYSSLSYLQRFPFDKIKIDRSFICNITEQDGSPAIVQAVVDIARSRNITTTAEGVELPEQVILLRDLGCTEMQGFVFSPAIPPAELPKLLTPLARTPASAA